MGVSTIATALARILLSRAFTVATFVEKMGVASSDIGNCTRKLYIREGLSPFANIFS